MNPHPPAQVCAVCQGQPRTPPRAALTAGGAVALARLLPRRDALPLLDIALADTLLRDELWEAAETHTRLPGIGQARELIRLADGRAGSIRASRLRLLLHDNEISGFELGHGPDLADPRLRIGLDCRTGRPIPGWTILHVIDRNLHPNPAPFVTGLLRVVNTRRRSRAHDLPWTAPRLRP